MSVRAKLLSIKHSQLIEDPFPEQTAYNIAKAMLYENRSPLERLLGIKFPDIGLPKPEEVSIWAAYHKGYTKAYAEIEAGLDSINESKPEE